MGNSQVYPEVEDCCLNGNLQKLEDILEATPEEDRIHVVDHRYEYGWTPLMLASGNGYHQIVQYLLIAGADRDAIDTDSRTPLMHASDNGFYEVTELLLTAGVDKEAADVDGYTPLIRASLKGHLRVVELLLAAGAEKDAANKRGWTALVCAAASGHHEVVELLLAAGANPQNATNSGRTALSVAQKYQRIPVMKVLSFPLSSDVIRKFEKKSHRIQLELAKVAQTLHSPIFLASSASSTSTLTTQPTAQTSSPPTDFI